LIVGIMAQDFAGLTASAGLAASLTGFAVDRGVERTRLLCAAGIAEDGLDT
jgi:hypothetical protein